MSEGGEIFLRGGESWALGADESNGGSRRLFFGDNVGRQRSGGEEVGGGMKSGWWDNEGWRGGLVEGGIDALQGLLIGSVGDGGEGWGFVRGGCLSGRLGAIGGVEEERRRRREGRPVSSGSGGWWEEVVVDRPDAGLRFESAAVLLDEELVDAVGGVVSSESCGVVIGEEAVVEEFVGIGVGERAVAVAARPGGDAVAEVGGDGVFREV